MAYKIALPLELANLHHVFRVSQLRKYITDSKHVLEVDEIQVKENLMMEAGPVQVLDVRMKKLKGKEVRTIKVLWDEDTQ